MHMPLPSFASKLLFRNVLTPYRRFDDILLGETLVRVQGRAEPDLRMPDVLLLPEAAAEAGDGLGDGVLRLQELVAKVKDAPVLAAVDGVVGAGCELPLLQPEEMLADPLGGRGELNARVGRLIGDEICGGNFVWRGNSCKPELSSLKTAIRRGVGGARFWGAPWPAPRFFSALSPPSLTSGFRIKQRVLRG